MQPTKLGSWFQISLTSVFRTVWVTFKKTLTFTSLPNIEMCTVQEQIGAQKLPCQRKPSVFLPEAGVFRVPRHSRGAVPGGGSRWRWPGLSPGGERASLRQRFPGGGGNAAELRSCWCRARTGTACQGQQSQGLLFGTQFLNKTGTLSSEVMLLFHKASSVSRFQYGCFLYMGVSACDPYVSIYMIDVGIT